MTLRGQGAEAMTLRAIAGITWFILLESLGKTSPERDVKRRGEGGSELNVTMT